MLIFEQKYKSLMLELDNINDKIEKLVEFSLPDINSCNIPRESMPSTQFFY